MATNYFKVVRGNAGPVTRREDVFPFDGRDLSAQRLSEQQANDAAFDWDKDRTRTEGFHRSTVCVYLPCEAPTDAKIVGFT